MNKTTYTLLSTTLFTVFFSGCGASYPERVHPNEIIDLSGQWNDSDSRLTAEELIGDCLNSVWLKEATAKLSRPPVVIVGGIRNETREHINTSVFVEQFQVALIGSKHVQFSSNNDERTKSLEAIPEGTDLKQVPPASGDYVLQGVIGSIEDQLGKTRVIYYQVNLKLIDVSSGKISWNGQKKIKKAIGLPRSYY